MCEPIAIASAGASIVGGLLSSRAASRQAQSVERADQRRSQEVLQAVSAYNQNSPAAALSRTYGSSLTSQIANMLGLSPSGGRQLPGFNGFSLEDMGRPDLRAGQPGREFFVDETPRVAGGGGVAASASGFISGGGSPATQSMSDQLRSLPGYQFQFNEGMRGIREHLSHTGGLYSGKALKEIMKYGQNFGETKYQTHLNNMMSAAGMMDSASVNTLNAATGNAAQTFSAASQSAQHRNDGAASLIGGLTGAAGAAATAITQPTIRGITGDVNTVNTNNSRPMSFGATSGAGAI